MGGVFGRLGHSRQQIGRYLTRKQRHGLAVAIVLDPLGVVARRSSYVGVSQLALYGGVTPYELKDASWDDERDNLVKNTMGVMDEFAPGFSSSVLELRLLLPPDIERIVGMPGGNTQGGDLTLDQMFFLRPAPGYADYRSPVRALYQCGASTHPGGSVSAVCGHNAAREILHDWPKLRR